MDNTEPKETPERVVFLPGQSELQELKRGAEKAVNGLFIIYVHTRDTEIKKICRRVIEILLEKFQEQT